MSLFAVRLPTSISYKMVGGPKFLTNVSRGVSARDEERVVVLSDPVGEWELPLSLLDETEFQQFYAFFRLMAGKGYSFLLMDWQDYRAQNSFLGLGDGSTTEFQLVKNYTDFQMTYAIAAVSAGAGGTFTIDGDQRWAFPADVWFETSGYDGEDQWYVVASTALSTLAGDLVTVITVTNTIPAGTATGTIDLCAKSDRTRIATTDPEGVSLGATPVDVSVNGVAKVENTDYVVDYTTGLIDFDGLFGAPPSEHAVIATDFYYEKIVRFDEDKMEGQYSFYQTHNVSIPVVEVTD